MRRAHKLFCLICALVLSVVSAGAQVRFYGDYATEAQTAFSNYVKGTGPAAAWLNRLQLNLDVPLWKKASFELSTLSSYGTIGGDNNIYPEFRQHSNIAVSNRLFSLRRLGLRQKIGPVTIFAGLGHINDDFYATSYASFFTGCQACLFPTSSNLGLADYPDAQLCLDIHWRIWKNLVWQVYFSTNSADDGIGDDPLRIDLSNQFKLNFPQDGWAAVTEFNWTGGEGSMLGSYHIGLTIGRLPWCDLSSRWDAHVHGSYFAYVEQPFWRGDRVMLGGLFQTGLGFGDRDDDPDYCKFYGALGLYTKFCERHEAGFFANIENYINSDHEYDFELSYKWNCFDWMYVQPAVRLFSSMLAADDSRHWRPSALFRVGFIW